MTRASPSLPRAAASSGRLRGVVCDASDGGWPDFDAVPESFARHQDDAVAIGERLGFTLGEPHHLAIPVAD
ncbi:MAG TPA: hypothetical protein VNE19_04550, partial [Methylomirabilota bacterium]|nr:hypothetical protein [Methylomirabilota bacterium]